MSETYLFPRLSPVQVRERLQTIAGRSPRQLSELATSSFQDAIFAATGGGRVNTAVLDQVRNRLLSAAEKYGFPDESTSSPVAFDPTASAILLHDLPIAPGEACRDDAWSFLTTMLLPDLTTWRFPDQNERRFLGGARNAFQRLWWRAYLLEDAGAPDPLWLVRLPEDALVGLMERPGISSNRRVAREIARAIRTIADTLPASAREGGWRLAYKRIRQRVPLVNLDVLPDNSLIQQLNEICTAVMTETRIAAGAIHL